MLFKVILIVTVISQSIFLNAMLYQPKMHHAHINRSSRSHQNSGQCNEVKKNQKRFFYSSPDQIKVLGTCIFDRTKNLPKATVTVQQHFQSRYESQAKLLCDELCSSLKITHGEFFLRINDIHALLQELDGKKPLKNDYQPLSVDKKNKIIEALTKMEPEFKDVCVISSHTLGSVKREMPGRGKLLGFASLHFIAIDPGIVIDKAPELYIYTLLHELGHLKHKDFTLGIMLETENKKVDPKKPVISKELFTAIAHFQERRADASAFTRSFAAVECGLAAFDILYPDGDISKEETSTQPSSYTRREMALEVYNMFCELSK